jgi:hypothetical protein
MNRTTVALLAALLPTAATAQDQEPAFRDFALVQRLRVVCSRQHFGRVQDLIAEVPSGKITGAVVVMTTGKGDQTVVVAFRGMQYDAKANVLQLGPCAETDGQYPAFDPSQVKVTARTGDGVDRTALEGTVLVSRLAASAVALQDKTTGSVQGLTLELASGHVAFLDVAAARERAGDRELHPVPWSAVRFAADATEGGGKLPLLAVPMTKARLESAPTLIEIIVQDALHRARVYTFFGVGRPDFDGRS